MDTGTSDELQRRIHQRVAASPSRLTPRDLMSEMGRDGAADRRRVRRAMAALVAAGQLAYGQHFGRTFLELSFQRPFRVAPGLILAPAGVSLPPGDGGLAVRLHHGAAFGTGEHPTTRLALRGIQVAMTGRRPPVDGIQALDLGTGSGVLVIAAVLLGAGSGRGIDTDPCARFEARENVALNGLSGRITIDRRLSGPGCCDARFGLVAANLRLPTLIRQAPLLRQCLSANGRMVMSGFRPGEAAALADAYRAQGLERCWRADEKNWQAEVWAPAAGQR